MEPFVPELERVLRSKRGVIAATVSHGRVAVMVSDEADIAEVRWMANELGDEHGAEVILLTAPVPRAPRRLHPFRQTALVAGVSGLLIAGLGSASGQILPEVKRIVLQPAPAPKPPLVVVAPSRPTKKPVSVVPRSRRSSRSLRSTAVGGAS